MDIIVENLTTGYGGTAIIQHMDLVIPSGKVTVLIGGNGCGKSTLLKTMCRIITPIKGRVLMEGKSIHDTDAHELARKIAILPQQPSAPEGLTVEELVGYGRAPYRRGIFNRLSADDRLRIDWALAVTNTEELRKRELGELSGGQRQRAWIAMAVAQDTDVLFLDEPTSFLDIAHQLEVLELVRMLHDTYGKTVVMVLHELNQAARYADYMIAMKAGHVVCKGEPDQVMTTDVLREVFSIEAAIMIDSHTGRPLCNPLGIVK